MVIKVYVAMISCSQEIKKNQQRAVMILDSKNVPYSIIDITDPACEDSKDYMVETATPKEGAKIPVTPQIYNEADYCGDYDGLDMANECDTLGDFLKLSDEEKKAIKIGITGIIPTNKGDDKDSHITNGVSASRELSPEKLPLNESNDLANSDLNAANESQPSETVEETAPSAEEEGGVNEEPAEGGSNDAPAEEGEVEVSKDETVVEEAASAGDVEVENKEEVEGKEILQEETEAVEVEERIEETNGDGAKDESKSEEEEEEEGGEEEEEEA